jgi:beta-lactamase class A
MSLEAEIQAAIDAGGAHMGVAARHLESGAEVCIHASESFPMASVLKIPVLVEAFRQVAEGRFALEDRWELTTAEKNLPSGILLFMEDGLLPTVRDLLTLMIIISDNSATDMIMHRLGTTAIHQTMQQIGLQNTHVVLTIRQIFESILPSADPTQDLYELAEKERSWKATPNPAAYSAGPDNDVSTPWDMTLLLEMIYRRELVNRQACDGMLEILLKQQLNDRLPRFLPPGTRVAHKTGTLNGIRNDAGIIYAGENSHVAVTVFARWDAAAVSENPVAEREQTHRIDSAFGHIGRILYEHFA